MAIPWPFYGHSMAGAAFPERLAAAAATLWGAPGAGGASGDAQRGLVGRWSRSQGGAQEGLGTAGNCWVWYVYIYIYIYAYILVNYNDLTATSL